MDMKKLVIIGASGHGKVIADIAKKNGYEDIIFLDDNESIKECGGYSVMGTRPLAMVDGILHVGLTSLQGAGPAVWMDGEIKELGFNGYISSISVWEP